MSSQPKLNPFPGLRPFEIEEDYLFFGREEQVAELLGLLREHRFLAVVGTSGSGKSSLVRAGLLPALHGGTMTHAGSSWEVLLLRPGAEPIANLAGKLIQADLYDAEDEESLPRVKATLTRSRLGLVEAVKQSDLPQQTNLLVVVDQFEELFRFHESGESGKSEAATFVRLLLAAAQQQEQPIYVAITMRSDYLGDCAQIPGLAEAVNDGEYLIPRLSRKQRRAAIEKPVHVGGGKIATTLVHKLLNEVGDDSDQLPVLQHALMRMWEVWLASGDTERPIDFCDFEATGGLASALSNHADEIYDSLPSDAHRDACEKIFKTLTEKGEDNRGIRRPTRLSQLQAIAGTDRAGIAPVLDAFRKSGVTFLMPGAEVPLHDRTVVDLSHESLMRGWQRLRSWVEEEAQSARIFRRVLDTARLWNDGKASLFRDPDLQIALSWREEEQPNDKWAEQYGGDFETAIGFLETSNAEAEAERRAKEAARQRELEQARELAEVQQLRLDLQQRSARKLRKMIGGLAVVALVAGIAMVAALAANNQSNKLRIVASQEAENARQSEDRAKKSADKAEQSALEANGLRIAAQQAQFDSLDQTYLATLNEIRSMRLARQSGWRSAALGRLQKLVQLGSRNVNLVDLRTEAMACLAEMDVRLQSKLNSGFNAWHIQYSPDGHLLAVSKNETISVLDLTTNREVQTITKPLLFAPFAYHPSGTLAVASTTGRLTYHPLKPEQPTFPEIVGDGHALNLSFSRSGDRVATVWGDVHTHEGIPTTVRRAMVHETATGAAIWDVEFPANPSVAYKVPVALSPDGLSLATVGPEREVRLYLVGNNEEPIVLGTLDNRICAIDFQPDGQLLVAAGYLSGAVFDLQSHSELYRIHAPEGGFWDVAFSPDGQLLAGVTNDEVVRLWDSRTGREIAAVPAETGGHCLSMSFSTKGDRLAVGGNSVTTFGIEGRRVCRIDHSPTNNVAGLAFDSTQSALLSSGGDRMIRSWKLNESGANSLWTTNRGSRPTVMRLAPDGRHLVHGFGRWSNAPADDFSLSVWSLDNSQSERRLEGPKQPVLDIAFDPAGHRLAAAAEDGGIHVWNFATGVLENRLELDGVSKIQYLDETQLLAIAGNRLILLAASDGAVSVEVSLPGKAAALVITPDRQEALVGDFDGSIHRVRLPGMSIEKSLLVIDRPSNLLMDLSPDGRLLAVSTMAGPRNLFIDPRTLEPLARLPEYDKRLGNIEFNHDGRYFAMGGAQIALWDLALVRSELMRLDLDFGEFNADEAAALFTQAIDHAPGRADKASIIATAARFQGVLEKLAQQMADNGQFQAELALHFAEQDELTKANAARSTARQLFELKLAKEPENSSLAGELADLLLPRAEVSLNHWTVLKPVEAESRQGTTLSILRDDSILAIGPNPVDERYRIVLTLSADIDLAAVRLEMLTDPSLPNNGPGRHPTGNFAQTSWTVSAIAPGATVAKRLEFDSAWAEREFKYPIKTDGHLNIFGGGEGRNCVAIWGMSKPVVLTAGTKLTVEMNLKSADGESENLGHFRLSVSSDLATIDRAKEYLAATKVTDPWARLAAAYVLASDTDRAADLLVKSLEKHGITAWLDNNLLNDGVLDSLQSRHHDFYAAMLPDAANAAAERGQVDQARTLYDRLVKLQLENEFWKERAAQLRPDVLAVWNFDTGTALWGSAHNCDLTVKDGVLTALTNGDDPNFTSPASGPAGGKAIVLRYRTDAAFTLEIFWADSTGPLAQARRLGYPVPASSGEWAEITLPFWSQGILNTLRLDPNTATEHPLEIDSIVLQNLESTEAWNSDAWMRIIQQQPGMTQAAFDHFRLTERWNEAAPFGLKLIEQNPEDMFVWLRIAPVLALTDDASIYADFCSRMVQQFTESKNPETTERVIKASLLRADSIDLARLPGDLLAKSLDDGTVPEGLLPWAWVSRAFLAYRSGDAQSAMKYVAKSEEYKPKDVTHALNLALMAMAQHQLGNAGEAKTALEEALPLITRLTGEPDMKGDHDLLIAEILLHEAEALMKEKEQPKASDSEEK